MRSKPFISIEEGFTLLEIMIALVILSIALVALAGLQVCAIKGNAFSKRMTTAVSIGNEKMEQLKNSSYANILSESSTQVTKSNMNFTRQVTVTNNNPLPNTKTVNVTVIWSDSSKSHSVPITTIISQ
jgi:prepilin-type N-terminal cleavage/methylation domain-containing protein